MIKISKVPRELRNLVIDNCLVQKSEYLSVIKNYSSMVAVHELCYMLYEASPRLSEIPEPSKSTPIGTNYTIIRISPTCYKIINPLDSNDDLSYVMLSYGYVTNKYNARTNEIYLSRIDNFISGESKPRLGKGSNKIVTSMAFNQTGDIELVNIQDYLERHPQEYQPSLYLV